MSTLGAEFLKNVSARLRHYKDLGERTFVQMDESDFHWQPSSESNSVAVLIRHMTGNMLSRSTNFLNEDGEKEWRQRDDEFKFHDLSKQELINYWQKGWSCFLDTLASLTEDDLMKTVCIGGEALTAVDAINRQLAHYSYHIGQIVYIVRMIRNEDWQNLSIPRGMSEQYNQSPGIKDPARRF